MRRSLSAGSVTRTTAKSLWTVRRRRRSMKSSSCASFIRTSTTMTSTSRSGARCASVTGDANVETAVPPSCRSASSYTCKFPGMSETTTTRLIGRGYSLPAISSPRGRKLGPARRAVRLPLARLCGRLVSELPAHLLNLDHDVEKRVDEHGIEMRTAPTAQLLDDVGKPPRRLIGTHRKQRIEHVADRADPARQRNRFAHQAGRISAAVPLFMVG